MSAESKTPEPAPVFDFDAYPPETCFHDRRQGGDRRSRSARPDTLPPPPVERRSKVERRRHVDPTTFERQYTPEELDFMNAMQAFKLRTGRPFPTYAEVLQVARELGYRKCKPGFEIKIKTRR
ncbi:MAG: hypothetical protein KatS3mg108_3325 [Isosphaeraceae bacterium]|jgi:hypothetical protein|nr:MAG: hypothetical protein KatS3mg108_3325 [Isosphaeraceae bacterium]